MADEKELKVTLKFSVDQSSVKKTTDGFDKVGRAEKETGDAARKARQDAENSLRAMQTAAESRARAIQAAFDSIEEAGDRIGQVSGTLAGVGAAITGPLIASTALYIQRAGMAEQLSRDWLTSQERLGDAAVRIGRITTQELLPFLEKAADLAEKAAGYAESHPELIQAALALGGTAGGIAAIGGVLSTAAGAVASIGKLAGMLGIGGAAAGAGGAAAGAGAAGAGGAVATTASIGAAGIAGLGLAGVGAGAGLFELMAQTDLGKAIGMQSGTVGKALASGAYYAGMPFGQGEEWFKNTAGFFGVGGFGASNAARGPVPTAERPGFSAGVGRGDEQRQITDAALQAYIQFQRAETDAAETEQQTRVQITTQAGEQRESLEANYEKRRTETVRNAARQQAQAEADFSRGRDRALRDFSRSEQQAERDYYQQRTEAARQFGEETARMEQDHQREMQRATEDHQMAVDDLVANRDAAGLYREQRSYEVQRRRAEEDYAVEAGRRNADYAAQLAEQEQAFSEQRAQRLADFELRRADELADFEYRREQQRQALAEQLAAQDQAHAEELAALDRKTAQQLADLDAAAQAERAKRQAAFAEQLRDMGGAYGTERATRNAYYAAMQGDLTNWLQSMRATTTGLPTPTPAKSGKKGSRAAGGWVDSGLYQLHQGEYVLPADQAQRLEMAGALGSGGSAGPVSISLTVAPQFAASVSDQGAMAEAVENAAVRALNTVLQQAGVG